MCTPQSAQILLPVATADRFCWSKVCTAKWSRWITPIFLGNYCVAEATDRELEDFYQWSQLFSISDYNWPRQRLAQISVMGPVIPTADGHAITSNSAQTSLVTWLVGQHDHFIRTRMWLLPNYPSDQSGELSLATRFLIPQPAKIARGIMIKTVTGRHHRQKIDCDKA